MKEYLVIEKASAYGVSICKARRFTDEEKWNWAEWFREIGFVKIGESQKLKHIHWQDMPKRKCDGCFCGCDNSAWIITPEEAESYIALDNQRAEEKAAAEMAEEIKDLERIVFCCEAQKELPSRAEARRRMIEYNNNMNEGGYGYVPHIYSIEEYNYAKQELARLRDAMEA